MALYNNNNNNNKSLKRFPAHDERFNYYYCYYSVAVSNEASCNVLPESMIVPNVTVG